MRLEQRAGQSSTHRNDDLVDLADSSGDSRVVRGTAGSSGAGRQLGGTSSDRDLGVGEEVGVSHGADSRAGGAFSLTRCRERSGADGLCERAGWALEIAALGDGRLDALKGGAVLKLIGSWALRDSDLLRC